MSESIIQKISLFFFYAFLDERQAIVASKKAIDVLNKKVSLSEGTGNAPDLEPSLIIHIIFKIWKSMKDSNSLSFTNFNLEAGWIVPEDINLGLWRQFLKDASEPELHAAILSQILFFSDADISKGLGVTVGTVRMRTSYALRKLGALRL